MDDIIKMLPNLLQGTSVAIVIFALTLLFALPLGMVVAVGRMSRSRILSTAVRYYTLVMRGTPLILQLLFVYFTPYYVFGFTFDRFTAAIVAFVLNYAAYFSEIYRAGISSIPQGQYEAAQVLGMTKAHTFFKIVLPQVVKRILPPMSNEFMTLVKDTALAQTIGVMELYRAAQNNASRLFSTLPIIIAGIIYLILNWAVEKGFMTAEKKLNYYR